MTGIVTEVVEFEMTSNCTCEVYDEETDTSKESTECFGCWEDDLDNFKYIILQPWLEANGWTEETPIMVNANNLYWNKLNGWTGEYAGRIIDTVTLNGEFILRWKLNGKDLTCVRASHDELGAMFEFSEWKDPRDK